MSLCSCGNVAVAGWTFHLCADRGEKRTLHQCIICDVALNLHILRLMGDPDAGAKAAAYAYSEIVVAHNENNPPLENTMVAKPYRIETFTRRTMLRGTQHYFRICSTANGKTVAPSEGYKNRKDRDDIINSLRSGLGNAEIVEVEK